MKKTCSIVAFVLLAMFLPYFMHIEVLAEDLPTSVDSCEAFSYVEVSNGLSQFIYNDGMLLGDAQSFSPDLAKASIALSHAAYDYDTLEAALVHEDQMGYTIVGGGKELYERENAGIHNNDLATYTIGYKENVQYKGETYGIYNVTVRGTYKSEWYSNFNLGTTGNHAGFYTGASLLYEDLKTLFAQDNLSSNRRIIWLTGHSRGAAISNLVAGWLTDSQQYSSKNHIFCYTFACPAVSSNLSSQQTSYYNIYNFNNPGDLVTAIPPEDAWGYDRYGQTCFLDTTHKANLMHRFTMELSQTYSGLDTTDDYLTVLLQLVPEETDMQKAENKLLFLLIGYLMGGKEETTILELVGLAGFTGLHSVVYDVLYLDDIQRILAEFRELEAENSDMQKFIQNHTDEVKAMTQEEFEQFLANNQGAISSIEKLAGSEILSASDFVNSAALIIRDFSSELASIQDVFLAASNLLLDSNGNILDSILHAHQSETYALWINSMYLGYRGWYENDRLVSTETFEVKTIGTECFSGCSALTMTDVLSKAQYIGDYAFYCCDYLSDVTGFSRQVAYVGDYAFSDCHSLTGTVDLSGTVKTIGNYAFASCSKIETVILPNSVTSIEQGAFEDCTGIKNLQMPISTTYAEYYNSHPSFSGCSGIERIHYTRGDGSVFTPHSDYSAVAWARESLQKMTFAEGITQIPNYAAYCCAKLTTVQLPSTLNSIGTKAFYDCVSLTEIDLPKSLELLDNYAFSGCTNLTKLKLPEGLAQLGASVFSNCSSLTVDVVLPEKITVIPDYAFFNCSSLKSVILHDGVTSIEQGAFEDCTGIKNLQMPISATYAEYYNSHPSFSGCSGIERIHYTRGDGAVFTPHSDYSAVAWARESLQKMTFAEGITQIPNYAAYCCTKLTTVQLPSTLNSIGTKAFYACTNLKELDFSCEAPKLGDNFAYSVTAVVFYPCGKGWTEDHLQNYGGTLTWSMTHGETEEVPAIAPTVGQPGMTAYVRCLRCKLALQEPEEIPPITEKVFELTFEEMTSGSIFGLTNNTEDSVSLQLIVAYYEESGKLITLFTTSSVVEAGGKLSLPADTDVPNTAFIKAYALQDEVYAPLCNVWDSRFVQQ